MNGDSLAPEHRIRFHRDLERLEADLQAMGTLARSALQRATRALAVDDPSLYEAARQLERAGDHAVDMPSRSGSWSPARNDRAM